jgi:hypothetical protein
VKPDKAVTTERMHLMRDLKEVKGEIVKGVPQYTYKWFVQNSTGFHNIATTGTAAASGTFESTVADFSNFAIGDNFIVLEVEDARGAGSAKTDKQKVVLAPSALKVRFGHPLNNARIDYNSISALIPIIKVTHGKAPYYVDILVDGNATQEGVVPLASVTRVGDEDDFQYTLLSGAPAIGKVGPHVLKAKVREEGSATYYGDGSEITIRIFVNVNDLRKLRAEIVKNWGHVRDLLEKLMNSVRDQISYLDNEIGFLEELRTDITGFLTDLAHLNTEALFATIASGVYRKRKMQGLGSVNQLVSGAHKLNDTIINIDKKISETNEELMTLRKERITLMGTLMGHPIRNHPELKNLKQVQDFFQFFTDLEAHDARLFGAGDRSPLTTFSSQPALAQKTGASPAGEVTRICETMQAFLDNTHNELTAMEELAKEYAQALHDNNVNINVPPLSEHPGKIITILQDIRDAIAVHTELLRKTKPKLEGMRRNLAGEIKDIRNYYAYLTASNKPLNELDQK